MQRCNEVKLLLKNWEAQFLKQHQRKPNKVDVENAPEDIQKLYKEYRTLKHDQESEASRAGPSSGSEMQKSSLVSESEVSSSWGAHLNRTSDTPKLTVKERDSLKASAQYFGMKLKAKLEGSIKERPISLRKTQTSYIRHSLKSLESDERKKSETSSCKAKTPPEQPPDSLPMSNEEVPSFSLKVLPSKLNSPISSCEKTSNKFHHLKSRVGERLTSLNHDWLERCKVWGDEAASTEKGQCEIMGRVRQPHDILPEKDRMVEKPCIVVIRETSVADGGMASLSGERVSVNSCLNISRCPEEVSNTSFLFNLNENSANVKPTSERTCISDRDGTDHSQVPGLGPDKSKANCNLEKVTPSERETVASVVTLIEYKGKSDETVMLPSRKGSRRVRQKHDQVRSELQPEMENANSSGNRNRKRLLESPEGKKTKKRKISESVRSQRKKKANEVAEEALEESPSGGNNKMSENLMGDVEEEIKNVTVHMERKVRPAQKKTDNFVRINLRNKSHVKGYALKGNRLRKQMWKQKFQKKGQQFGGGAKHFNRGDDTCFRCGATGHWASECTGNVAYVPPSNESEPEDMEVMLPTLEDVAKMTNTQLKTTENPAVQTDYQSHEPVIVQDAVRQVYEPPTPPPTMPPLYELDPSGIVRETPAEVYDALAELGYRSFRPGQEKAIMRILSGLSSLVILSTGMGKSLCYQLPAYLYAKRSPCITLVISPLVSLMDDQVSGLPSKLKAVCIHSNMTRSQREAAIEKVKQGSVHVLLLSPEALVGGGQSVSSCLPAADQLPPVAFACIDEVHCVSEWSHNFRPCYLRLCKVLHERLGVRCLLGLTATATIATAQDVARHLGVSDEGGVPVRLPGVPSNLHLSSSVDRDKDQALITLLKGERFGCLDSVIVYCTRREETTRIAALLRTCLQGVTVSRSHTEGTEGPEDTMSNRKKAQARKKIRRPLKWVADSYHAGMSGAERRRVQNNFMSGQLRLVVATVAFGMGLDKSDVRGIIHYNMPKNFESYVQEIGRAGRDGKDAQCHLFLDPVDMNELRRHVYADTVDYFAVKKLVQKVFPRCKCKDILRKQEALGRGAEVDDLEMLNLLENSENDHSPHVSEMPQTVVQERVCYKHERAIPIQDTVQALDIREEGIETLLCYLELHPQKWLELLHPTFSSCRIVCYSGPQQLRKLATSCPPVAVCLARERLAGVDHTHVSSVEFNVVELADSMGWEVVPVKRALRDLQWAQRTIGGFKGTGKSGVLVEFSKLSFHFRSYGDLADHELEDLCDFLHHKVVSRESAALHQLMACYKAFKRVAYRTSSSCAEKISAERSAELKDLLLKYFEKKDGIDDCDVDDQEDLSHCKAQDWKDQVRADVRLFLSIHQEERFNGRAISRVFHGIGSPCYPAEIYGRDRRFWRKYIQLDFNELMQLCKEEIIRFK